MSATENTAPARAPLEQGDPAADARAFRRCLGQYPTGVTVVTAQSGQQVLGMAVNSFAAVSLDPPLVLWSIRRESRSADDFLKAGHFAVNVLAADQVEVSQRFGSGDPERFTRTAWQPGLSGAPLLDGAIAHLECRTTVVHEGGDHLILVGQVLRYARFEGEPLVFSQGQYAVAQSPPCLVAASPVQAAEQAGSGQPADPASFLRILSLAHQRMSSQFEAHRQVLGVTPASTRVLHRLYLSPCEIEVLERATYLGQAAFEDALADLVASGDVVRRADGLLELTPAGRLKSEAVAQRSHQFTEEKLQGIAAADVMAARRVLLALQDK